MRNDVAKQRATWWTIPAATIAGLAIVAAATGALAHDGGEREWNHRGHHFIPPGHVHYAPPPYFAPHYYAPRPMYAYQAPVYYEPAPAYYSPPGLNINIPLW